MLSPLKNLLLFTALSLAPHPNMGRESISLNKEDRTALTLTLYQQGFGLVQDTRPVELPGGEVELILEHMTDQIDATSLRVFGGPEDLTLIEQSRLKETLNPTTLLKSHVGKKVLLIREHPKTGKDEVKEATLISVNGGTVLQVDDRIEIEHVGRIALPSLPEGLRSQDALSVTVASSTSGMENLTFDYLTNGMGWVANYVITIDDESQTLDLTAYVTLSNDSGQDFDGAELRLIAGDVTKKQQRSYRRSHGAQAGYGGGPTASDEGFSGAQSVSDRYLYTLERPIDLAAGERKAVALLSATSVPVKRIFRFSNLIEVHSSVEEIGPVNADIELKFGNKEEADGLGRPLPAGKVRVYEVTPSGDEIFAGEDSLSHRPKGGEIKLDLGKAFDITGKSYQTEYTKLSSNPYSYESAQEVIVENAKENETVTVEVIGNMPRGWRMLRNNTAYEKKTARQIVWQLTVPAGGSASIDYKVRVTSSRRR